MPSETTILDFINYDCLSIIENILVQEEQPVTDEETLADKASHTAIN